MDIISKQKLAAQSWVGGAAAAIVTTAVREDGCDRLQQKLSLYDEAKAARDSRLYCYTVLHCVRAFNSPLRPLGANGGGRRRRRGGLRITVTMSM
ncbi:MAG: hypothetical protein GY820_17750, partial [Gammaproteobacteria bacterium]|nr:hypothetical protein [Gammaproteobacteria bacterium]